MLQAKLTNEMIQRNNNANTNATNDKGKTASEKQAKLLLFNKIFHLFDPEMATVYSF